MQAIAPKLVWDPDVACDATGHGGGWIGTAPAWPLDRTAPAELDPFLDDAKLLVVVACPEAYPAASPRVYPVDPAPEITVRTQHRWHINGDGSICLWQNAYDWWPATLAAHIIPKVSGWFLEYLLLTRGHVAAMTTNGIAHNDEFDHLLTAVNAGEPA